MDLRLDLQPAGNLNPVGWGAQIASAEVRLGHNYTGLEDRLTARGAEWPVAIELVEEICGCCSQANALAFVQAVESIEALPIPSRGLYLRLVLVELERIASHLLNAARTMRALEQYERETRLRDFRECLTGAVDDWTGERRPSLITIGGLARNIGDAPCKALATAARAIEHSLRDVVTDMVNSRELARRLAGLGRITAQEAMAAGLRGPVARASGITLDIRANVPAGAYETEGVTIISQRGGDVFSRLVVRLLECLESFRVIEQALDDLPPGPVKGRTTLEVRDGSGVGRVEGPRGEVFCWVRGGAEGARGLHLSAGSFPSIGVIPGLLAGQQLEDVELLLLSLDLCLSSIER